MRYCVCLIIQQLLGRDRRLFPRSLGPSIGIAALSWFESHLELCVVLSIVWRPTKVIVGVNVRSQGWEDSNFQPNDYQVPEVAGLPV